MTIELKKSLKLIKYAYQLKSTFFSGITVFLAGILFLIFAHSSSLYLLGAFYLLHGPMCVLQTTFSLLYTNMAKASPRAHMLEIELTDFLTAIISLAGYTLIAIYTAIRHTINPDSYPAFYPLVVGMFALSLMLYWSLTHKTFFLSIALLLILIILEMMIPQLPIEEMLSVNITGSIILGYAFIFIGIFLSGLLRRILYKMSLSKLTCSGKLRKQLYV